MTGERAKGDDADIAPSMPPLLAAHAAAIEQALLALAGSGSWRSDLVVVLVDPRSGDYGRRLLDAIGAGDALQALDEATRAGTPPDATLAFAPRDRVANVVAEREPALAAAVSGEPAVEGHVWLLVVDAARTTVASAPSPVRVAAPVRRVVEGARAFAERERCADHPAAPAASIVVAFPGDAVHVLIEGACCEAQAERVRLHMQLATDAERERERKQLS